MCWFSSNVEFFLTDDETENTSMQSDIEEMSHVEGSYSEIGE